MTRDRGLRLLLLAIVLALGGWVLSATEWVEVEIPVPMRGKAAKNDLYATQELVRRLGGTVKEPQDLSVLPGPQDTLLLTSLDWDMFPERAARLRAWVQGGGQLVVPLRALDGKKIGNWIPVLSFDPPKRCIRKGPHRQPKDCDESLPLEDEEDDEDEDTDAPGSEDDGEPAPVDPLAPASSPLPRSAAKPPVAASAPPSWLTLMLRQSCHETRERTGAPPAYADRPADQPWKLCDSTSWQRMKPTGAWLWSLDGRSGPEILRVAVGRGSVTVMRTEQLFSNRRALLSDNGLAIAQALQVRAGRSVWFVDQEDREPLLAWLWQQAWIVFAVGGLALAFGLWRGGRRFGPPEAVAAAGRRSMAEQITGTAQFLWKRSPGALLAAQIRALDETARTHVLRYDRMDRATRAKALADATGLDPQALEHALDTRPKRRAGELAHALELLETARRRLGARTSARRKG